MGYYTLIDAEEPEIKKYSSRIGTLVTLLNSLDYSIQIFVEVILDLESDKKTTMSVFSLIRNFEFSKRLNFLKSLIKSKHSDKFDEYLKLHDEIIKCSEIRNKFAHSQVYFWDDDKGTHMMISSIRKIEEYVTDKLFDQVTLEELESEVKRLRTLIDKFNAFTYELGYFQGHAV